MDWDNVLKPETFGLLIPILALIYVIVLAVLKHRERMAMIEQGIHPDSEKKRDKDS